MSNKQRLENSKEIDDIFSASKEIPNDGHKLREHAMDAQREANWEKYREDKKKKIQSREDNDNAKKQKAPAKNNGLNAEGDIPLPPVVPISDVQKKLIEKFKERVREYIKPFHTDDTFIRFLRARAYDLNKATEMFVNSMKWRAEVNADNILETFPKNKYFKYLYNYWPARMHGVTKDGWPVFIERIGAVDARGLLKNVPENILIQYHIWVVENDEKKRAELFLEKGVHPGIVIIQDLAGLGWKHIHSSALNCIKKIFAIDQNNYPEALRKLYVVNAPRLFQVVFGILKPWVDPQTLQKVVVLGTDYKQELLKVIDETELPPVLGGKCRKCNGVCIPEGGKFPDLSHLREKEFASENTDDENNSYNVVIPSGGYHEHEIVVDEVGTVICLEFSSENYNIGFGVYRRVDDRKREEILSLKKYDAHIEAIEHTVTATSCGRYVLRWDNTYSKLRKKVINYQLYIERPAKIKEKSKNDPSTKNEPTENSKEKSKNDPATENESTENSKGNLKNTSY